MTRQSSDSDYEKLREAIVRGTIAPNSRLVEFADAGHAILHQCAARLNDVLLDHLERVDSLLTAATARSLLTK